MDSRIKNTNLYILITSILGYALSLYSVYHRENLFVKGTEGSFCNINSTIDCDSVALSSFSSFLGIPTAAWALAFYALLIVFSFLAFTGIQDRNKNQTKNAIHLQFLVAMAGLVPTVLLIGVTSFVLKKLCLLCLGNYLFNFAIAFLAWKNFVAIKKLEGPEFPPLFSALKKGTLVTLVLFGGFSIALGPIVRAGISGGAYDKNFLNSLMASHLNEKAIVFRTEGFPTLGEASAPVTLVEFADYQCPTCKLSAQTVSRLVESYGGKVRHIFKNYPLDNTCNPEIPRPFHKMACVAAKSSWCVFKIKGPQNFFTVKSELFKIQESLKSETQVFDISTKFGDIDLDALKTCVASPQTHQEILDQIQEGKQAQVKGTPAIYINGRYLASGPSPIPLRHVLDIYLTTLNKN